MTFQAARKSDEDWERAKAIFEQCLELPEPARGPYLDRETKGNEYLRREIEKLLAGYAKARDVKSSLFQLDPLPTKPSRIGNYTLLELIGSGGMAEVYLARVGRSQGFKKLVAVKRVLPEYIEDANCRSMFEFEAKLCSRLNHRNIVQVYDFVKTDEGYYLVMDYVAGKNLLQMRQALLKIGDVLPLECTLYVIGEVLKALEYAHSRNDKTGKNLGIIHRDVTPKNIMVGYDGSVKLLDFGIAKAKGRGQMTQTGSLRGTVHYLSPEYASGKQPDTRSDLFSVGALLYELIAGTPLFDSKDSFDVLKLVRECKIPQSRVEALAVPVEIKTVLTKALAKEPNQRYGSASEFGFDLQQYLITKSCIHSARKLKILIAALFKKEAALERKRDQRLLRENV